MASAKSIAKNVHEEGTVPRRANAYRVIGPKRIDGLVSELKRGVEIGRYDMFVRKSGLPPIDVNDVIQLRPRTLVRRRKEGRLSQAESERLYRLSVVFEKAVELHEGKVDEARHWMSTPKAALAGQTPLEMCATEVGAREVEDLIGLLEYGVFS
jgi:putative toxin-antitoxin system antitoxin component (TIGR02293 family)